MLKLLIIDILGQYYLPQESHSSIRFLKDVLSGKKKVSNCNYCIYLGI